ncbi:MAG: sodium/proline symporter [Cyanobacteria bacterium P01_G01_bin.39]
MFLGIGAFAAKFSTNSESDYLLGNRSFGKLFIGLSAGATSNSGWIMTGGVGFGYSMGTYSLLVALGYVLGDLTFWSLFPDKINKTSLQQDSQTVPELIGLSVKSSQGKKIIAAIVAILTVIFVGASTAAQFSAAAKTLNAFFGLQYEWGVIIAAATILVYCVTGGIRASIWTDVVQAFVVMFVTYSMLFVGIMAGGGVAQIIDSLYDIDPQLIDVTLNRTWWSLVACVSGFIASGLGFNLGQPQFLVRLMAGRNPQEVKQARWIYLGFAYSTYVAMLLFGIICRVLLPNISDPEQALPLYAIQNFNPILVGIVLAGVFSVIASTADSQILVCSSAVARDIIPSFYHKMSRRYGVRYQQFMTLLVGIVAAIASIFSSASVFELILFSIGALAGSIAPAMLITILNRRTHFTALSSMMLVGLGTAIAWRVIGLDSIINEALPAIIISLVFHEILMKTCFKLKQLP